MPKRYKQNRLFHAPSGLRITPTRRKGRGDKCKGVLTMRNRKSLRRKRVSLYSQLEAQRKRRELAPKVVMFFVALIPALMICQVVGQKLAEGAI